MRNITFHDYCRREQNERLPHFQDHRIPFRKHLFATQSCPTFYPLFPPKVREEKTNSMKHFAFVNIMMCITSEFELYVYTSDILQKL